MMVAKDIVFLFLYLGSCMCVKRTFRECEKSGNDTLVCVNKIPTIISKGVSRVFLKFVSANILFEGNIFYDASWENITYLDITAKWVNAYGDFVFDLDILRFGRLKSLQELKIHGDKISTVSVDTFRNIPHLSVLEFSDCQFFAFNTLVDSLLMVNVTIDKLSINHISTASQNWCYINDLFLLLLRKTNIEVLSLKHSYVKVTTLQSTDVIRPNELDISDTVLLLNGLNIKSFLEMIVPLLGELITLNASEIPMGQFLQDPNFFNNQVITGCHGLGYSFIELLFLSLENLYVNKIFPEPVVMNNTLVNISNCKFSLKRWHFRDNRLQYFNLTINLPMNNTVIDFDFFDNEIVYISSNATRTLTSLEILNLGRNNLNHMETLPEFEEVFMNLVALKYLSLAENKFSHLPRDLLRNNRALQSLDLSGNFLTTLTVSLKHIESLLLLDLRSNRIRFLEGSKLGNVQMFSKTNSSSSDNPTARIEIDGNPLECSCESSQFIQWVIMVKRQQSNKTYVCTMENGNQEINEDTLRHAQFLCYRTTVIICSAVSFFVITVIILLLTKFIRLHRKRQKQKNAVRAFLNDFLKNAIREKFLCHISYASEDERCVLDDIFIKLGVALTTLVGTRRNFICIGDKDYCLGRPIVDEIFRCISESCVMLFVISESFCRSHWCEMELREARELDKPIILIFKEHVKEESMSAVLKTIFNRLTRAKLVENNGKYEIVPNWNSLGESIIKLATEKYITEKENFNVSVYIRRE